MGVMQARHRAALEVAQELDQVATFNNVVRGHLAVILAETEKASYDIVERLQTIWHDVSALSMNCLAEAKEKSVVSPDDAQHQKVMLQAVDQSHEQLDNLLMETMASIQFQDVTRQQIEAVIDGLGRLDTHAAMLSERLKHMDEPNFVFQPLSQHLEEMFLGYVTSAQRSSHTRSLNPTEEGDEFTDSADRPAQSAGPRPKIELF